MEEKKMRNLYLKSILCAALILCLFGVIKLAFGSEENEQRSYTAADSGAAVSSAVVQGETPPAVDAVSDDNANILNPDGDTLAARVNVPAGYQREEAKEDSLTAFLREYPLKKEGSPVLLYHGEQKENQQAHIAVFRLPLEKEDLQQCADSVMRVYAEYFWKTKQYDRISFHLVDGFEAKYERWREGYRISPGETGSSWVTGGAYDASYKNFKKYLRMVFAYASTVSMEKESKKIKLPQIETGDIFIKTGNPGHVAMVVDVCQNAEGKKAFLLGQGFMPAQEFHLLKNPAHEENPWYYEEEVSYPFKTPEFTFKKGSLRRLSYGE